MNRNSNIKTTLIEKLGFPSITLWSVMLLASLFGTAVTATAQEKIVFLRHVAADGYEIFTMNPDGSGQTRLTNLTGSPARPSYSPDGSKIIFDYQVGFDAPEIFVINADGTGTETNLTNDPAYDWHASYSPDGSKIVFMSARDGRQEIYIMNADGTNPTRLTNNQCREEEPSFSPDGTMIIFEGRCEPEVIREIYVINADGTNVTNLTNKTEWWLSDFRPVFSPDGGKIVFASNRPGPYEIFIMNSDGTNPSRLTFTGMDDEPSFSPDGTKIVFMSPRDGSSGEIYVMDRAGTNQTRLTFAGGVSPSWWGPRVEPSSWIAGIPTGADISRKAGPVTITFSEVTSPGVTTVTEIDAAAAGTLPSGYSLGPGMPGYEITTTASYVPPLTVCFYVPWVTDEATFDSLRILHGEGGGLVDRTILAADAPAPDFSNKTICARVNSLSPFVVAQTTAQPPNDTTAPTAAITSPSDGATYTKGQTTAASYLCADEAGGSGIASCVGTDADGAAINTATVGSHSFTVTATDVAGNSRTVTHTYNVVYEFAGFFQPVDSMPTLNVMNAGSSVAVKFSLGGNQGLSIFAPGYPVSSPIACDASEPGVLIENTVTAGHSNLSYDAATGHYNYVWKTEKAWKGTCRMLVVRLNDNTDHLAKFRFR